MKNAIYILIIILLAALQTTILSGVQIFGATADLLLAFVVLIALNDGAVYGGAYGLFCGIVADTLMLGRFGYNSFVYMYAGVFIGLFKEHFFRNNGVVALLCSFLASFVHKLLYFIFAHYIWGSTGFLYPFFTRVIIGAAVTSVFTLVFYIVNIRILRKKERKGIKRRYGF